MEMPKPPIGYTEWHSKDRSHIILYRFGEEAVEFYRENSNLKYPEDGSNYKIEIHAECHKPQSFWTQGLRELLEYMEALEKWYMEEQGIA